MLPKSVSTSNKNNVNQVIDLTDYLGDGILRRPDLVQRIGQDLIDTIVTRTNNGRDINNNAMSGIDPYSKNYRESDEFKAYNKTRKVNMELTGEMLADINITSSNPRKLTIGFNETLQSNKAHGHLTGMKFNSQIPAASKPKPRLFFGVTEKEITKVTEKYKKEIIVDTPFSISDALSVAAALNTVKAAPTLTIEDILGDLFGEG